MATTMIIGLVNPTFAQYGSDTGKTTLNIESKWWVLIVKTFGIDFGTVWPSTIDRMLTWTIVWNGWYITVQDTLAESDWYVTVDATNMIMSGNSGTTIADGLLNMTSIWWTAAVTTLSGWSTTEIAWVANTNVDFSGSNWYTVIERIGVSSGRIGKYGIQPTFKLNLPAYTPIWSYLGDFVATIYKN